MKHLFLLGSAPELAAAELSSLLGKTIDRILPNVCTADVSESELKFLSDRLGGTVKILREVSVSARINDLPDLAVQVLIEGAVDSKSIQFGISLLGVLPKNPQTTIFDLTKKIKQLLIEQGQKARFVLPKAPSTELSSVVVSKQKISELVCLFKESGEIILGQTVWVQDFAEWGKRDYGRPEAEGHIGMIPPKVARMMINLATGNVAVADKTLLDPFCGVGTILAEAMVVGLSVVGSDSQMDQIRRSEKNLAWIKAEYGLKNNFSVQHKTSETISLALKPNTIDYIVTEPDLGPSNENFIRSNLATIGLKLAALYERSLADWIKVLKKNAVVVMVVPSFNMFGNENTETVKKTIDKAKVMGYSLEAGPFSYYRPQAVVRRNICVFRLIGQ